jgi:hypothetical protein
MKAQDQYLKFVWWEEGPVILPTFFRGTEFATERRRRKHPASFADWWRKKWRNCRVRERNCRPPARVPCARLFLRNRRHSEKCLTAADQSNQTAGCEGPY